MHRAYRGILPITLLGLGLAGPVSAADYEPPLVIEDAGEFTPVEVGNGWYLRGDVGYILKDSVGSINYRTFDATPPGAYSNNSFSSRAIGTDFTWGGGFGYRFTDWLRADATVEGFRGDFSGTTSSATACVGEAPGTSCRSQDGSSFSAIGVMANGYVDLGTFVGVTPYVGAGVGYSLLRWDDLTSSTYCVGAACSTTASLGSDVHKGDDSWRFTYALMAGFAYDITSKFKVDVGYKFRHIQGGNMFAWDAATAAAGASGIQGRDSGLSTHEVKIGLRYELW